MPDYRNRTDSLSVLDYQIESSDFDRQKRQLKQFAQESQLCTELNAFETGGQWSDFLSGGLLGLFDHKVTGEEMNKLIEQLQNCFFDINQSHQKVIREFGQVYETFEALDKGYIQGILIGVKSAEKASQEAKAAQKDVDVTIRTLEATVKKLKSFKSEMDSIAHLRDTDAMWDAVQRLDMELKTLSNSTKRERQSPENSVRKIEYPDNSKQSEEALDRAGSAGGKHIKLLYVMAGSALCLSILQLVLLFMGKL